ncbi:hypothetical protein [Halomicrobium sp. LC1Hm]|uniref:hypothetical protein n=1 Tax=Halomicrobium sp. LC1Hm TaxID=2610902 RepID=UPI002100610B|nr:hypothetical protein [Halomicrobium sp. LC1Hm]
MIVCSTVLAGITVGQQNANNTATPAAPTGPAGGPSSYELVIDENVGVVDYQVEDGEFVIDFYSDEFKSVTISAAPDTSSQSGSISFRSVVVEADTTTTVRITSSSAVSMWTDDSLEREQAHYLRKQSDFLISGPWTGSDVRDAALGGALGVVLAVLYEAVAAKVGATERGERVA